MALPFSQANSALAVSAKYTVTAANWGTGAFPALPSIAANSTGEAVIVVTRRFRVQRVTELARPAGTADPAGVSITSIDCIAPASAGAPPRVRIRWSNSTAGALTPASQQYDIYQY